MRIKSPNFHFYEIFFSCVLCFMLSDTVVDVVISAFISIRQKTEKKFVCECAWMCLLPFSFFVRERFYFSRKKKLNIFAGYRTLCDQQADDEFSCTQKKNARRRKTTATMAAVVMANKLLRTDRDNKLNWVSVGNVYWICFSHATHTHTAETATATNWEIKGTIKSQEWVTTTSENGERIFCSFFI